MVRVLSEEEFQSEAALALKRIFVNEDPYNTPFSPIVESRLILFKYRYHPEPPLLNVLVETAQFYGDHGFYASILDRPAPEERMQPYHWFVPFSDIGEYESLVGPVENAIYSPKGTWGLMGSHDWHGLLGATQPFIQSMRLHLPQLDQDVLAFLEEWKDYHQDRQADVSWIPPLLFHVYGEKRGKQLLAESGLTP
jgi:hypothetical protein